MSAAVLTFVSDVCCGLEATGNWAAAADAALWLVLGYDYNGYGMMNIHYEHAVLQSSTATDGYARTMRSLAGSCMCVAYLFGSVGRLAV